MRLFYVPDPNRSEVMVTDVPDDIGKAIDIGCEGPDGGTIVVIDHDKGIFETAGAPRGVHRIPERYWQTEGHGEGAAVVAYPSGARYPFRWAKKKRGAWQ